MPPDSQSASLLRERLGLLLILVSFVAVTTVGCGVPISAEEITATAEAGGASLSATDLDVVSQASARSASTLLTTGAGLTQPSSSPAGLGTQAAATTATLTPTPSATPSLTPAATGTATASTTPDPSGTPTASATSAASVTGTPAAFGTPAATKTPAPAPASAGSSFEAAAVAAVNQVRTNSGRSALTVNAQLTSAAEAYARYMADQHFFGHDGLDGSSPQGRIVAAGYAGSFRGEALAAGQTSAQSAVATWLNSPAHAAILLEPSAVEIGIGLYDAPGSEYGHYWVLETGAP